MDEGAMDGWANKERKNIKSCGKVEGRAGGREGGRRIESKERRKKQECESARERGGEEKGYN